MRPITSIILAAILLLPSAPQALAADAAVDAQAKAPEASAKPASAAPQLQSALPAGAPTAGDEEFIRRVKTMEEQVTDLKEKVFRTRSRLMLLQESIMGGASIGQGARALLIHRNEMGGSFVLESAAYALDGAPIYNKIDLGDGTLGEQEEIELFNGRIVPGQHQIVVQLRFRGHGFGVFKYLDGYKFTVQSSYTFDAEADRFTQLKIVAFEQGNFTTEMKDRPAIRYEVNQTDDVAAPPSKSEDGKGAAAAADAPGGK